MVCAQGDIHLSCGIIQQTREFQHPFTGQDSLNYLGGIHRNSTGTHSHPVSIRCHYPQLILTNFPQHTVQIVTNILLCHGKGSPLDQAFDLLLCAAELEIRSEEHTSELQSRENLVCRLLLEKKKKK